MTLTIEIVKSWKCLDEQEMNGTVIAVVPIHSQVSFFSVMFEVQFSHLGLSMHIPLVQFETLRICFVILTMGWWLSYSWESQMTLDALKSDNLLTLKLATIKTKIWSAAATGLLQCETSQVSTQYFHKNEKQLGEKNPTTKWTPTRKWLKTNP